MDTAAMRSEGRRMPAAPIALAIGLAVLGLAATWLGLANWITDIEYDPYAIVQDSNAVPGTAIGVGALCWLSMILVLVRTKVAAFAALFSGISALGAVILLLPTPFSTWAFYRLAGDTPPWEHAFQFVLDPGIVYVYFFAALSLSYVGWLTIVKNPDWFSLTPSGEPTAKAHNDWLRTVGVLVLCALVWLLLRSYGFFSLLALANMPRDPISLFGAFDGVLSFFASAAILIVLLNERAEVAENGVRIVLAPTGWALFKAPWKHIKRVEVVNHNSKPPSAVIKCRFLGFIPVAFTVHARRYSDGTAIVGQIAKEAQARQKTVANWYVTDNAFLMAVTLVAWGCFGIIYVRVTQHLDWVEMSKTNYPPANFEAIAAPVYYGVLNVLSLGCFGAALGVLSAFHCAGVRPFLVAMFLCALAFTAPDNIIHWLVWIAIFHIYMAMPGQDPNTIVPHPTWQEWNLGMTLSSYAPVFAVGFYLLAVIAASKKVAAETHTEVTVES